MGKKALITGITGQDGSYLAELLLAKTYDVHGMVRPHAQLGMGSAEHLFGRPGIDFHYGDMSDRHSIELVLKETEPDEIYNLASQSHVGISFRVPRATWATNGNGAIRLFEAAAEIVRKARIYQAGTSEMFGSSPPPQSETTLFCPLSPYARAKIYAFTAARHWRDRGSFICNGILFNHESPRRPERFVTAKISRAAARIATGSGEKLRLGRLDTFRDWGGAPEYVETMWLMLQQPQPDDYVIATGETHSVEEYAQAAFLLHGFDLGLHWRDYVEYDQRQERPADVPILCGDASKAERILGWRPKINFRKLVVEMKG